MYGNYLGILLGLLTVLLAFKAFSPGDHRFILMVCVVFLLFSSVASYDLKFMLLLPLFLIFAGMALHIANQIDVAVRVAGTTGSQLYVRFGVGWGFLAILIKAILGIIALSVVTYTLTPHSAHENRSLVLNGAPKVDAPDTTMTPANEPQDKSAAGAGAQIGIGSDFDLTDQRKLSDDPRPVLRMKSHKAGYLRAQVYDVYSGSSWVKSPQLEAQRGRGLINLSSAELPSQPLVNAYMVPLVDFPSENVARDLHDKHRVKLVKNNIFSLNETSDLSYDINRQEIQLLEAQPPFYFAVYQPYRLENISLTQADTALDLPMTDMASTLRPIDLDNEHPAKFTYTVFSLEPRAEQQQLAEVFTKGPPEIVSRYTQLPLEPALSAEELRRLNLDAKAYRPISKRLRTFARQFGQTADGQSRTVWDTVIAIRDYLLDPHNFKYSRDFTPIDSSQELTEAFVLGTQQGFCRQFSSAMTVLCRLNGVPARVVSGYSPGEFSIIDNAYIYHANNAHAWVEVYFDGYGWITFDPTPSAPGGPAERRTLAQTVRGVIDFLQELFVIDPASTQQSIMVALGQAWVFIVSHAAAAAVAFGAMVALGLAIWLLRRLLRRKRPRRFTAENSVIAAFVSAAAELARLGVKRQPGDTARSFTSQAVHQYDWLQQPLGGLLPLYEQAAFAPSPPTDQQAAAAQEFAGELNRLVAEELKARKRK
jgi:transglutaminase-like putative cysteine protease